tara:strand:+ start:929 stop:1042 length:114 start_codon:yes stop_codon:yes gene_type:complete
MGMANFLANRQIAILRCSIDEHEFEKRAVDGLCRREV